MCPKKRPEGLAFICEDTGKIVEVIANSLSGAEFIERDSLFPAIVDRESMGKALSFLLDIRRNRLASDWELNITLGGKTRTMHFYGLLEDNKLLIVGALNNSSALRLLENTTKTGVKDVEGMGDVVRERSGPLQAETGVEGLYWDELSRLYNELSNLQRESAKQNVELKRLNELKNQFLGTAAHDLRNPIWMIRLYSQFLLEDASSVLNEEQVEFLNIIQSHSENMQQLVDSYLDYSTVESGKLKLERKPSDLLALIKNNIHMNQPLAAKKQIELLPVLDEHLPPMNIDPLKIDQVLNNLISNAIRFSLPQTRIEVSLRRSQDEAVITVKDEGVGIPEEKRAALFDPFEGERETKDRDERSAGLGLFIARKIVDEHGGRIWLESEVGEGSTFHVALLIENSLK